MNYILVPADKAAMWRPLVYTRLLVSTSSLTVATAIIVVYNKRR